MNRKIRQLIFGGAGGGTWLADVGLLLLRVFVGLALALGHGYQKLSPNRREMFIDGVGDMGFPVPLVFGWAAILSELVGGLLLALGLATRPATVFIALTMGTAAFIRHADDPFSGKERALLFLFIAVAFMLIGAGRYSVDALIRGGSRRSSGRD